MSLILKMGFAKAMGEGPNTLARTVRPTALSSVTGVSKRVMREFPNCTTMNWHGTLCGGKWHDIRCKQTHIRARQLKYLPQL